MKEDILKQRILPQTSWVIYRRLLTYVTPHRRIIFWSALSMFVFGASDGALPFLLKHVLDDIFGAQNKSMLWVLVAAILTLAVFRGIFGFIQRYLSVVVGLRIVEDLRNDIATHLLRLPPSFFGNHSTGTLLSSVTNDTLMVRRALTDAVVTFLRDSIRVISLFCAAFILDPMLSIVAFTAFPLAIIPVMRFGKKVRKLSRAGQDQLGGLTSVLHEGIIGHKVVQSFTMEPFERERFADENHRSTKSFTRAAKYGALSGPVNELLAAIAIAIILVYGGLSVISGVRTQGDFIAFITAMMLMYEPLKNSGRVNGTVQTGIAAAERIFEILDLVPEIADTPEAKPIDTSVLQIEYRGVSFRYEQKVTGLDGKASKMRPLEEREWALDDVSFSIAPGQTIALVGPSGGGKSTLVNLLPRFYDPQQGSICINNQDLRSVTLHSLRSVIAIVDQNTFLFDADFFHNISYGRPQASEEEVIAAAIAANAHDFIMALPQGYQTRIGEQGLRLSGGQRARISIARALLKNAPVLILDEATASLDSESEVLVQRAIDTLMEGRTVLVIAHRLSTIRNADRILVVSHGKIVESGSHTELVEKSGEYAKLYRLQFHHAEVLEEQTALRHPQSR